MNAKILKSETDYNEACERLYGLMNASVAEDSPEYGEMEILGLLIDDYESKNFPIPMPDPIEAILFKIKQMGISDKEFAELLGGRQRKSEILNRKRRLSLSQIRKL